MERINMSVTVDDKVIDVTVEYEFEPGWPEIYPDQQGKPDEVIIESITDDLCEDMIPLMKLSELRRVELYILESYED